MLAFIIRRLASTVLVMAIVAVIIFLLLRLAPGDPVAIIELPSDAGAGITGSMISIDGGVSPY